jgi:hypothetical protein
MECGGREGESLIAREGRLNNTVSVDGMWGKGGEELDWGEGSLNMNITVSGDGMWGKGGMDKDWRAVKERLNTGRLRRGLKGVSEHGGGGAEGDQPPVGGGGGQVG